VLEATLEELISLRAKLVEKLPFAEGVQMIPELESELMVIFWISLTLRASKVDMSKGKFQVF
jgi:hypothetical protein